MRNKIIIKKYNNLNIMNIVIVGNGTKRRPKGYNQVLLSQEIEITENQIKDESYLKGVCELLINNTIKKKKLKTPLITAFIYSGDSIVNELTARIHINLLDGKLIYGYHLDRVANEYSQVGLDLECCQWWKDN